MDIHQLYQTHKNLVYNVALQYVQNVQDAEEITQDVFVSVHKNIQSFKAQSNVKTWIYRIAVNKSLDYIKSKNRQKRKMIADSNSLETIGNVSPLINFNHPGIELEQKESLKLIFDCINQLSDNQKTALILLKIEGLSQVEVADIMKLSPKAIESLFQRAKKNLSTLLNTNEGL